MSGVTIGRRTLLAGSAVGAAWAVGAAGFLPATAQARRPWGDHPFRLGVASGDPLPESVVIWTRLAPRPLEPDGGVAPQPVPVHWKVCGDEALTRIVREGTAMARPEFGHSVHVDVRGLEPRRVYYYQFRCGSELSTVGRTRTAPAYGAPMSQARFAFACCQSYSGGFYTAHQHMAEEDLDAVIFLGDYIYEGHGSDYVGRPMAPFKTVESLSDFRIRYAQYHTDPNLQTAHQAFPWIPTLDDHEVRGNWWDNPDPAFQQVRANAFRAYWENLPLRDASRPRNGNLDMRLYRRLRFGDLATLHVLDTRQYRDRQPVACTPAERTADGYCPEQLDPQRTILGAEQKQWLIAGLGSATSAWNLMAQQVFFTQRDRDHEPGPRNRSFNLDGWDGYVADRQSILDTLQARDIKNLVVLTGDSHKNWVLNTPPNIHDWDGTPVATDFMVTSITSGRQRPLNQQFYPDPANNPQELYIDASHGYGRLTVTRGLITNDFRAVSRVDQAEGTTISTVSSWAVENGHPGAQLVGTGPGE